MRKHTAVFLFSIALFAACKKETATGTIPEPNNTYKDEFTTCNCAESNNHEISGEYIKAIINGIPVCADLKGNFYESFDNMFTYGMVKRSTGETYWDNLYMIRYTKDGKFMFGIFMENTHLLTKQFPYELPRADPEFCEIGEMQLINQQQITSNMCLFCTWSDWHYLGAFFGSRLKFTADKFENGFFEGRFEGSMATGSGRVALIKNGQFRIKLTLIQRDIIIP
jgi:hypothetical protein